MLTEYSTADFNLAVYLYLNWLLFIKFIPWEGTSKGRFVFRIPATKDIDKLLEERELSENQIIRDILYKAKLLKAELKNFYNKS